MDNKEKIRLEGFKWSRGDSLKWFEVLGEYQVRSFLENANEGSLLDLACGDGTLTKKFTDHFRRIVGVDASKDQIAKAEANYKGVEFDASLIEEWERDEKFDNIALILILEHLKDPVAVLKRVKSFLKPRGKIIAQVPNAFSMNRKLGRLMGILKDDYELTDWDKNEAGHRRCYTMKALIKDFNDAGLEVTSKGGVFFKIFSSPQMEWLLNEGKWNEGLEGWDGKDKSVDYRKEFLEASYRIGKDYPEECNVLYACGEVK